MATRVPLVLVGLTALCCALPAGGEVKTVVDHNDNDHATPRFAFAHVPPPSRNDAATSGVKFTLVDGKPDNNANDVNRLHDGLVPDWEDEPVRNFAFETGNGGRLLVDLNRTIDVAQVNTYSWHPSTRGPQVYYLWGADGQAAGFDPEPHRGTDPTTCGWTRITAVDTRADFGNAGGQYGVSTFDSAGAPLGHFRYLLLDVFRTERQDDWGNTFYSELDVVEAGGPKPAPVAQYWQQPERHDPPGDPMDWKPPANPPPLKTRYDDANYGRLSKKALAGIDVNALRDPSRPLHGILVQTVKAGSQAAKLGIAPGDILMSIDGASIGLGRDEQEMNSLRAANPQQLTYWSPHGGIRTVTIQPGLIGVRCFDGQRFADRYARSSERDPRYEHDILIAATTFMSDPFLAETALFRAQQHGYDGQLLAPLAARIAFYQCRFDDVLAYEFPAPDGPPRRLSRESLRMLDNAALLGFKLDQALDLCKRFPEDVADPHDEIARIATAYHANSAWKQLANPMAELDNVRRRRARHFTAFMPPGGMDGGYVEMSKWGASIFNAPQPMHLDVESGHYMFMEFGPAYPNVCLTANFDIHDTDKQETEWAHAIDFAIFDATRPQPQTPRPQDQIRISLMTDGVVLVRAFGLPQVRFDLPRTDLEATRINGTIRIAILHDRCEVTLDGGRRLFYGPVPQDESKRRFAFSVQPTGSAGFLRVPIWESLEDPRAKK